MLNIARRFVVRACCLSVLLTAPALQAPTQGYDYDTAYESSAETASPRHGGHSRRGKCRALEPFPPGKSSHLSLQPRVGILLAAVPRDRIADVSPTPATCL